MQSAVTNTVAGQVTRFYRDADGALVKSRQSSVASSQMAWLHGDHLGSASLTTNVSGQKVAELRYLPFGETRWAWGTTPTDRRYTGQRELAGVGLYDYNARMYWPAACPERSRRAGRFVSADTVVPRLKDPQAFNRYAYARNSPLVRVDPTGHIDCAQYFGLMDCVMAHYAEMALIAAAVAMVPVVVKAGQEGGKALANLADSGLSAGEVSSPPPPPDPNRNPKEYDRYRKLGEDPHFGGRWRESESDTAWRLEKKIGRQLDRFDPQGNPYKHGDWIDQHGTTYDSVGNFDGKFFNRDSFIKQIQQHLIDQGLDNVVIDYKGLTGDQIRQVQEFLRTLDPELLARIIELEVP